MALTGNVIAGNGAYGVSIIKVLETDPNPSNVLVALNWIGTDATGTLGRGNGLAGMRIEGTSHVIGGLTGLSNVIANNGSEGGISVVGAGTMVQIRENTIRNNGGLGIDLGGDGVTPNDPGDADTGANGLQNFPVITSAVLASGTDVTIDTTSFANTSHNVRIFSVQSCNASGHGEGATLLGIFNVTAPGVQTVNVAAVPAGWFVTATASGPSGTSEFSACRQVTTP